MIKPKELIDLLKVKPAKLAMHKFNDGHTAKTFDNLVNNLNVNSILKICNFSENYMFTSRRNPVVPVGARDSNSISHCCHGKGW